MTHFLLHVFPKNGLHTPVLFHFPRVTMRVLASEGFAQPAEASAEAELGLDCLKVWQSSEYLVDFPERCDAKRKPSQRLAKALEIREPDQAGLDWEGCFSGSNYQKKTTFMWLEVPLWPGVPCRLWRDLRCWPLGPSPWHPPEFGGSTPQ